MAKSKRGDSKKKKTQKEGKKKNKKISARDLKIIKGGQTAIINCRCGSCSMV